MIRVGAIQFQLSLQRYAIGETTLQALVDGVAGRVDIVIQELKNEVITRVGDREILGEDFVEAFVFPVVRIGFQLEEILERLKLNIQKIRIFERLLNGREAYSFS